MSTTNIPPLAKYFASTEKKTRDKAVKNLAAFLSEAPQNALSTSEMDKLWKGVFYCFWMSDKPLVQQALATELAEILLMSTSTSASLAFLRGFWKTTVREWNGIDRLRIDKYYMLVRRYVNASFRLLIRSGWEEKACATYNDILTSEGGPLNPTDIRVPTGLTNHVVDIYLDELEKAMATTTTPEQTQPKPAPLGVLVTPFLQLMAQTSSSMAYKRVETSLVEPLLEALELSISSTEDKAEDENYANVISNACIDVTQNSEGLDSATLRQELLTQIFNIASRPETKDASRRRMYAIWQRGEE